MAALTDGAHVTVTPAGVRLGGTVERAMIENMDRDDLLLLTDRLRELDLLPSAPEPEPDRWLDSGEAAGYLGITRNALHKLTAPGPGVVIPFEQDCPGGKCWFLRSELAAYRRGEI